MKSDDRQGAAKRRSSSPSKTQGARPPRESGVSKEKTTSTGSSPRSKRVSPQTLKDFDWRANRKLLVGVGAALLVLANLIVLSWWIDGGNGSSPTPGPSSPIADIRGPRPDDPSLSGLELNVPVLVPGPEATRLPRIARS